MKRIFIIGLILFASTSYGQSSIYDLSIDKPDGTSQGLSSFKGKKMVIAVFPIALIDDNLEHLLDSLQAGRPDCAIILQPGLADNQVAGDSTNTAQFTAKALNARANKYLKSSGVNQGNLARWLSSDALNGHFGAEFNDAGNFFFIDQNGQLVGVSAGIPNMDYLKLMLQ